MWCMLEGGLNISTQERRKKYVLPDLCLQFDKSVNCASRVSYTQKYGHII